MKPIRTRIWLSNRSIDKGDITFQSNVDDEFELVEIQIETSCDHLDPEPSQARRQEVNNPQRVDGMPDAPDVLAGLEQEDELQPDDDVHSGDANSKRCSSKKHAFATALAVGIIVLSAIIIIWLVMDRSCEAKPEKHPIDLELELDHHHHYYRHLRRRLRCKN